MILTCKKVCNCKIFTYLFIFFYLCVITGKFGIKFGCVGDSFKIVIFIITDFHYYIFGQRSFFPFTFTFLLQWHYQRESNGARSIIAMNLAQPNLLIILPPFS